LLQRHELIIEDGVVGELVLAAEIPALSPASFVRSLSEQISSSLDALIEAERLRRQAAVAKTMHLVEALSEHADPDDLGQLVEALAALPNALGARLEIVHPVVGGAAQLEAGSPPAGPGEPVAVAGGTVAAAVRWSAAAQPADRTGFADILSMLAKALNKAEERRVLRDEAETDPLTGIGNRRRAVRALASAISFAERSSASVGVLFVDLDHFKRVNDTLGHEVGDRVLCRFAQHLTRVVRGYDTVARFGGEEFVVVCPGLDETSGVSLARRMLDSTTAACTDVLPAGWVQTASVGLACYPEASDYVDGILRAADRALYGAKRAGRNQVQLASRLDG
jgi:diguanylate cyclase (GGDEF)-like protein